MITHQRNKRKNVKYNSLQYYFMLLGAVFCCAGGFADTRILHFYDKTLTLSDTFNTLHSLIKLKFPHKTRQKLGNFFAFFDAS